MLNNHSNLHSELNNWPSNIAPDREGKPFGSRSKGPPPDPDRFLAEAYSWIEKITAAKFVCADDLRHLKFIFSRSFQVYYTLSAISRRDGLNSSSRDEILGFLYRYRSILEGAILDSFSRLKSDRELERSAYDKKFFGVSKKQGVSIRFPLISCVPTQTCGGRCYAHDGRDRELHLVFRAALNYYVGSQFEAGSEGKRIEILNRLKPALRYGVSMAQSDARAAAEMGYVRLPRIRFSHIGEMVALPHFANALASEIKKMDREIQCVIYTRHPSASKLDDNLFIINFTLEENADSRKKFIPPRARIVNSSWDGKVNADAEINFLEHHVEKVAEAEVDAKICPVTASHSLIDSCDKARCVKCFVPTMMDDT
jgi:hypothetical protein